MNPSAGDAATSYLDQRLDLLLRTVQEDLSEWTDWEMGLLAEDWRDLCRCVARRFEAHDAIFGGRCRMLLRAVPRLRALFKEDDLAWLEAAEGVLFEALRACEAADADVSRSD